MTLTRPNKRLGGATATFFVVRVAKDGALKFEGSVRTRAILVLHPRAENGGKPCYRRERYGMKFFRNRLGMSHFAKTRNNPVLN